MKKNKSLAEQANRFMNDALTEDFLSAPQPATTFDPFAPNYGDTQKVAKLPIPDEKKPMETDATKDVDFVDTPQSSDEDNEGGGNKTLVKKIYSEMSMLMKDIIVKAKNIDDKFDKIVTGIDSASNEKITALEGINTQLYEDVERFNGVIKSVLDMINSVNNDEEQDDDDPEEPPKELKEPGQEETKDETGTETEE